MSFSSWILSGCIPLDVAWSPVSIQHSPLSHFAGVSHGVILSSTQALAGMAGNRLLVVTESLQELSSWILSGCIPLDVACCAASVLLASRIGAVGPLSFCTARLISTIVAGELLRRVLWVHMQSYRGSPCPAGHW